MRSGTIDHSAKKPVAVQRSDGGELVVAQTPDVTEVLGQRAVVVQQCQQWLRSFGDTLAGRVLYVPGRTQRQISPARQGSNIKKHITSINIDYAVRTGSAIASNKRSERIPTRSV
jgi:hypothetical protein